MADGFQVSHPLSGGMAQPCGRFAGLGTTRDFRRGLTWKRRYPCASALRSREQKLLVLLLAAVCGGRAIAQADTAPRFARNAQIGDLVFVRGEPIANITMPAATGGDIDAGINAGELSDYSFDPVRLPEGLTFDRFTRVISGAPRWTLGKRTYHLWVHDDDENWSTGDADSLRFTIEVVSGEPPPSSADEAATPMPAEFSASFESEFQWFNRDRLPRFSGVSALRSAAWRGERIQRQILVAGRGSQDAPSVDAGDLRSSRGGAIPASAVSFRYPHFVIGDIEARGCGAYPERFQAAHLADALAGEPPRRLPRSYPSMIWMAIDVPDDAHSGNYAGTVTISSRSGDVSILDIALEVQPWSVPPVSERRFHLDLWQFPVSMLDRYNDAHPRRRIDPWSEEHYRLLEPFYRYLAWLGQRAVTTYIKDGAQGAPSMIRWIALDNGERWQFDYAAFDRHVERLAGWGIDSQISAFSPVGWNNSEIPFWDEASDEQKVFHAPLGSQTYNALWNLFLTDFKSHLIEKGWFEKTVLYMDEVPQDEMEAAIGLIRYNDANWKIGLAYGHAPDDRVIRSLYDVSGYYESEIDVGTYDHQLTTFYTSCTLTRPNNYVAANANPADMAAMPWYAMARGHDGYLRWAFDHWTLHEPLDLRDGSHTAGDFSFVYRSSNDANMTVVPSVRSELLHDGIEDFEKLIVLQEAMRRCDRPDLLDELGETIESFSTDALISGAAPDLLTGARAALERFAKHPGLANCR
ncbi:MAG: DUF4091 domain-containing protein [Rhodospirillaceae bacterium]|nr:DUF4091 domain-containing protein [Rhodospirillaceae bacterium]MDE0361248.1 DUF4091 domain-containing protein [Rhodospirillaceae bacterium]